MNTARPARSTAIGIVDGDEVLVLDQTSEIVGITKVVQLVRRVAVDHPHLRLVECNQCACDRLVFVNRLVLAGHHPLLNQGCDSAR
jgi:hypothetical protein